MKKIFIIIIIVVAAASAVFYFVQSKKDEKPVNKGGGVDEFVQCLAEAGVVIYGSKTCSACASLAQEYGGYERIKPIYVECSDMDLQEERERCIKEMQTGYIPEIQIKGELFTEWGSPDSLAEKTGCQL